MESLFFSADFLCRLVDDVSTNAMHANCTTDYFVKSEKEKNGFGQSQLMCAGKRKRTTRQENKELWTMNVKLYH